MIETSKLEAMRKIFKENKTEDIFAIWSNGLDEVIVLTDGRNYKVINIIMCAVAELFDMDEASLAGGPIPSKYMQEFKQEGRGYYVD